MVKEGSAGYHRWIGFRDSGVEADGDIVATRLGDERQSIFRKIEAERLGKKRRAMAKTLSIERRDTRRKKLDILKEALGMYVNLVVLLGTGAGVTWWATRRLEERIQKEVQGMDRLQSIEMKVLNIDSRVSGIENRVSGIEEKMTGMATKEDLNKMVADMTATMVAKDDLNKMIANMTATMATKEDLNKMVAKDDLNKMIADMTATMATKDDLAKLLDAINNRNGQGGPG